MEQEKKKRKWWQVTLWIIAGIVFTLVILWAGYLGGSHLWLGEYYSIKTDMRDNPGINDGYIVQGTAYEKEKDIYLTSGYMMDGSNSRVYSIDKNNKSHYAKINKTDGSACTNHFGGITIIGKYAYVACGSSLGQLNLTELLNQDSVNLIQTLPVETTASFVFSNNVSVDSNVTYADIYVGEFNDGTDYITNHPYTNTDNETTQAILVKYHFQEVDGVPTLTKEAIYSIRDKVQGFCVTSSGNFVLSTSYGLSYSHFYIYQAPSQIDKTEGTTPVYYLDSRYLKKSILAPAMSEDLDYYDGKVLYSSESASNKYFFGKIFFYTHIYGLTID